MRRDPTNAEADAAAERIRRVEREVERQIREAIERGELSGLPGEGRPLPPDPDEGAGDRWSAAHIARAAEVLPEWGELRREIVDERRRLARRVAAHRDWLDARGEAVARVAAERILEHARATDAAAHRFEADLDDALRALNAKISRYDLLVPGALQIAPLTRERLESLAREER